MDFVNNTALNAAWTMGFQPDGRETLVVIVKSTFSIPKQGHAARLSDVQIPLTEADESTGEPGISATLYETDYSHKKPACDVLLNGSAYSPHGNPVKEVTVAMHVSSMRKAIRVVGNRIWRNGLLSPEPSDPELFTQMPITYDRAYGGVDRDEEDPLKIETYCKNPVGVGYYPLTTGLALEGKALPNLEEIGSPIRSRKGNYQPMSFGPIGRNFESRIPLAGTYDDQWLKTDAPFFPKDFDYRYFQAATSDQQIPYPQGGETVFLENLALTGQLVFRLPPMPVPILFLPYRGNPQQVDAVVDTIVIEPDQGRFTLTSRGSLPLRQNCFEIRQVIVGGTLRSWRREQDASEKPHYSSIVEYIEAKRIGSDRRAKA